jgi:diguanylate cyclase (GGDEF)-like protein
MPYGKDRIPVEDEILERQEHRYTEEEQLNHLAYLLSDRYRLLSASVLAFDPGKGEFTVAAHRGLSRTFLKETYGGRLLPLAEAALSGEVAVMADDPRRDDPAFRLEHRYENLVAVPCLYQGEAKGVLVADSADVFLLTEDFRRDVRAYAALSALYLAVRELKGRLERVPDTDVVTGLCDFRHFHEALHREILRSRQFGHPASLVILKVRNLARMNEVYGHVEADRALAAVADCLRAEVREVDCAARAGVTLFLVMPEATKAQAAATAERIVAAVEALPSEGREVRLRLSGGVGEYPADGATERVLIPHVESMVLESMRRGGSCVTVYPG